MHTSNSIILGSTENGEHDELVSTYTEEFGKIIVKARGVKKITTKQGNFLHSPSITRCCFALGRAGYILSGIKNIEDYPRLNGNLAALGYVLSFFSLCDDLLYEGQKDEEMWKLLVSVMHDANSFSKNKTPQSEHEYLWKQEKIWLFNLLHVLGLGNQNMKLENIKNYQQLDRYIQRTFQNKFERPIYFFGLKFSKLKHAA